MRHLIAPFLASTIILTAGCSGGAAREAVSSTVQAQVDATLQTIPPEIVTVEVPVTVEFFVEVPVTVEVPIEVPVTVQVPVAIYVDATVVPDADEPSAAAATLDPMEGTSGNLLFAEDFVLPDYWDKFDLASSAGAIESEQYVLTIHRPETLNWTLNGRSASDFYFNGLATITTCKAGDNYGLLFRATNNFNFYMFGVSCDGKYRLIRNTDGVFETIVPWTQHAAVNRFAGTNLLGVRAVANQLSLFANEQMLTSVQDEAFNRGLFGMYVAAHLTPGLTGMFDDLMVYPISP